MQGVFWLGCYQNSVTFLHNSNGYLLLVTPGMFFRMESIGVAGERRACDYFDLMSSFYNTNIF